MLRVIIFFFFRDIAIVVQFYLEFFLEILSIKKLIIRSRFVDLEYNFFFNFFLKLKKYIFLENFREQ